MLHQIGNNIFVALDDDTFLLLAEVVEEVKVMLREVGSAESDTSYLSFFYDVVLE